MTHISKDGTRKLCTICKESVSIDLFARDGRMEHGILNQCTPCVTERKYKQNIAYKNKLRKSRLSSDRSCDGSWMNGSDAWLY